MAKSECSVGLGDNTGQVLTSHSDYTVVFKKPPLVLEKLLSIKK